MQSVHCSFGFYFGAEMYMESFGMRWSCGFVLFEMKTGEEGCKEEMELLLM
jgi:hypothetical protein